MACKVASAILPGFFSLAVAALALFALAASNALSTAAVAVAVVTATETAREELLLELLSSKRSKHIPAPCAGKTDDSALIRHHIIGAAQTG